MVQTKKLPDSLEYMGETLTRPEAIQSAIDISERFNPVQDLNKINRFLSESQKHLVPKRGEYDFKKIPLNDPRVWALFGRGDTKGIFQLEKQLGQDWAKRAKPHNIEELAALVSILRPGPLESGMSDQYVRRKHGEEDIEYLHPLLEPILKETYGCLIYQEQAMRIAVDLAGFNLVEADTLRKAIGKKKPEVMAEAKKLFMTKAAEFGKITQEEADEIFGWIEKSVRYSFNKSHAVSYAMISYFSAYQKVHFPKEFYTSWLTYSDWKPDQKEEIYELVQNARRNNVTIIPPDVRKKNIDFEIMPDGKILFGLSHIRGVGSAAIKTIMEQGDSLETLVGFIKSAKKMHRNVAEGLIKSGACDCYGVSRTRLLRIVYVILGRGKENNGEEHPETKELTPNEYKHFIKNLDQMGIQGALYSIVTDGVCVKKRISTITAKISYLDNIPEDTNRQRSIWETLYIGVSLTSSAADDFGIIDKNAKTCREILNLPDNSKLVMHVVLDKIKQQTVKKQGSNFGKQYCFLSVSDNTGCIDNISLWSDVYEEYKSEIAEGLVVTIYGQKKVWKGRSFINANKIVVLG